MFSEGAPRGVAHGEEAAAGEEHAEHGLDAHDVRPLVLERRPHPPLPRHLLHLGTFNCHQSDPGLRMGNVRQALGQSATLLEQAEDVQQVS
jgi:hypothetical protein